MLSADSTLRSVTSDPRHIADSAPRSVTSDPRHIVDSTLSSVTFDPRHIVDSAPRSVTSDPRHIADSAPRLVTSDPRHIAMETYWREVQSIEEEEDERKSLDQLELEEAWLVQSGLSALTQDPDRDLDQDQNPEDPPELREAGPVEALLSTLTRRQTDTVRRRLDNYTHTLRQHNRPIRDVRHIFTQTDSDSDSSILCESPKRFHTTTRTIRRHNARVRSQVRPSLSVFIIEDPPTPAQTPPLEASRAPGWLLRDTPYSEGVAEHRRGGACPDCVCFRDDANDEEEEPVTWFSPDSGLSSVEDFSEPDLRSVGFISHIELHTLLQSLGQNLTKTKTQNPTKIQGQRRTKDCGVFGVPLEVLLEIDRRKSPETRTPVVFNKLLCVLDQSGLQTEGILRISGSASRLKSLRRDLDRCLSDFVWSGLRPVDAAGLLKLFIRELPSPLLLTHPHTLRSIIGLDSELHQVQSLQLLSLSLPESHRNTLQELLAFLARVAANKEQNRMSLWNVSMVMAPNLLPGNRRQEVTQAEMEEAVGGAKLVRLLIRHRALMWTRQVMDPPPEKYQNAALKVPCFLLAQVRQMNQASNQRSRRRCRRHVPQERAAPSLCDDVIRVRAPLQLKVSTAMKLDATTTARDVTERFPREPHSASLRLYEVGGNIGERRLHPDCFLLDVYRLNPSCDWLVKP